MRCFQRICVVLGVLSVLWIVGGCTQTRELGGLKIEAIANPTGAPAVKIVKVADLRKFETDSTTANTPTVRDSAQIKNPAVTSRTIGAIQKSVYYTLPEGQTVEAMVEKAVQNALRSKGYAVVANDSPSAANATPVTLEIRKCWFWLTPGFWTVQGDSEVEIDITSPIALNGGTESAKGAYSISSPAFVDSMVEGTVEGGLQDLDKNLKTKLKEPR